MFLNARIKFINKSNLDMCLNQESTKSHKMDTNSIPRIVIYIIRKVYERSLEGLGFRNFKKKNLKKKGSHF